MTNGRQPTAQGFSTTAVASAFLPFVISKVAVSVSVFTTTFFCRPMAAGWQENCAAIGRSTAGALPAAKLMDCGAAQVSTVLRCRRRPGNSLTPLMRKTRTLANMRMAQNLVLLLVSACCTETNTDAQFVTPQLIYLHWTAAAGFTSQVHRFACCKLATWPLIELASQQMRKRQISDLMLMRLSRMASADCTKARPCACFGTIAQCYEVMLPDRCAAVYQSYNLPYTYCCRGQCVRGCS